jgi:hypothetical protein
MFVRQMTNGDEGVTQRCRYVKRLLGCHIL